MYSDAGFSDKKPRRIYRADDNIQCAALRSDGKLAAVGTPKGDVFLVDMTSRTVLRTLTGHLAAVKSLGFLSDKVHIVSTSDDRTVRLWNITLGKEVWCASENTDFVRCCGVSQGPGESRFITGSYDHTVSFWDQSSSQPLLTFNHGCPVEAVCFLPLKNWIVSAGLNSIKFWNAETGTLDREVIVHHRTITALCATDNEEFLLTGSLDQSIKILSLKEMTLAYQFKFSSSVLCIAISVNTITLMCNFLG